METPRPAPRGLWLPLVTPFRDGALDEPSLRRLVRHYGGEPVDGLILGSTTGEALALDEAELARIVAVAVETLAEAGRRMPLWLGLSGCDTRKLAGALARTASWPVDGYLVACPYYVRPSQEGLLRHFSALAEGMERPILLYNIPYRTGVNLANETLLRLARRPNIVGLKDCSADAAQSSDLLRRRPAGFTVLTGEDALFLTALAQGADGGILASAHVETRAFAAVRDLMAAGDWRGALAGWQAIAELPRLLFAEPNPAPVKHWLWRSGLIDSPEVRLPLTGVTAGLADRIEGEMARRGAMAA